MQAGEYILSEGARLEADSRFFIIEDGVVECRKTLEVRLPEGPTLQAVRVSLKSQGAIRVASARQAAPLWQSSRPKYSDASSWAR